MKNSVDFSRLALYASKIIFFIDQMIWSGCSSIKNTLSGSYLILVFLFPYGSLVRERE
jgi:hypothetical protein